MTTRVDTTQPELHSSLLVGVVTHEPDPCVRVHHTRTHARTHTHTHSRANKTDLVVGSEGPLHVQGQVISERLVKQPPDGRLQLRL